MSRTIIIIGGGYNAHELALAIALLNEQEIVPQQMEEISHEMEPHPLVIKRYEEMTMDEIYHRHIEPFLDFPMNTFPTPRNTTIRAQQLPIKRIFRTQHKS